MRVIFLGCGYLGYNLYALLKKNFKTEMWGIDSPYVSKVISADFREVDVFDPNAMANTDFEDAIVIDTVALVANTDRSENEREALDHVCNVYRDLLATLKKGKAKRFIYFSSGGTIYGSSLRPISEEADIHPETLYAKSKAEVEGLIQESGLDYLILRLSNPYGGYQISGKRQGVIPILIRKALSGNVFEQWIDSDSQRDYFYIDDLANAITGLIQNDINNEIVNVGSGIATKLSTVISVVEQATGKKLQISYQSSDVQVVQSIVLDITKLHKLTGYVPTVSLEEGIRKETERIIGEQNL